jgi:tRNA-dihydrouridine synthase
MVGALGFDGVDINMGCPAKNVANRGCGAALIRNPPLAKEIIRAVKRGVADWANGMRVEDLGMKPRMAMKVQRMNAARGETLPEAPRRLLPVSVKTRIGYDSIVIEDWVQHLLEEEPVAISIHGRTLKQMYTGQADWDAIARAAEIIRKTPTLVLGNGDITQAEEAVLRLRQTGVHGVLIGRGAMGNPWLFREKEKIRRAALGAPWEGGAALPSLEERFQVTLEHARLFNEWMLPKRFPAMRKHFAWYCRGMPKAAELRAKMFQTKNAQDVEAIIHEYLSAKGAVDPRFDFAAPSRIAEAAEHPL